MKLENEKNIISNGKKEKKRKLRSRIKNSCG